MTKRFISVFSSAFCCCLLIACSNSTVIQSDKAGNSKTEAVNKVGEKTTESTAAEQSAEPTTNSNIDNNAVNKVDSLTTGKTTQNNDFVPLYYGDPVKLDFVEMTVNNAYCSDEIYPSDTSSVYTYYPDVEDEKYFYLQGNIKNISENEYDIDDSLVKLCFDDKYNYFGYVCGDYGNKFENTLTPLKATVFYICASVPDEIIDTYSKCDFQFGFKENFSRYKSSNFDNCDYLYQITVTKQ